MSDYTLRHVVVPIGLIILFFAPTIICWAAERVSRPKVVATVNYISDGDGLVATIKGQRWDVRYAGWVDAEEWNQPYGPVAKNFVRERIKPGDKVRMKIDTVFKSDRGERLIAFVYTRTGRDISYELVRAGLAWATRKSPRRYRDAMRVAQRRNRGLWKQNAPIPPWDWRHAN